MPPKRTSTSAAPTMTQAAIRQLVADSVTKALEAQAANMVHKELLDLSTGLRVLNQCFLIATVAKTERIEKAYKITWVEFKKLLIKKYCPRTEELVTLCPTMVLDSKKIMEAFIGGLPQSIKGNVTASKPQTLEEAINIAHRLMDQVTKHTLVQVSSDHKRKFNDIRTFINNNYPNSHNHIYQNNCNNDSRQQQNKRQETGRSYAATLTKNSGYTGNHPMCKKCTLHHTGPLTVKCNTCNKVGRMIRNYKNEGPATGSNLLPVIVTCHACGEKGHYANQCRKTTNNNVQGRAYMLRDKNAHRDSNIVTGMFLLNQHLARVLFDSRADKSFISISLASMLNIPPITIHAFYNIKMADGFGSLHKTYLTRGSSQNNFDDKGYWDSGCSRHMTGNISYLSDFEPFDRGYVSFGQGGCKITSKGTIKIGKLEFENVYFVKDLKYNLFSVSQICDNKNSVLFTDSECIVLGRNFKLSDDDNVLLRTPRQHNMYSIDLNNIVPHKYLTCLVAKASADEWKQHKASCKSKLVNFVSKPLHTLHMDLFGPTSISSISHKWYCLVVTDDFSRCDNGGEFRNKEINNFCSQKGIKREFSNARTPQQNGVAKRRNKTLIEAARTMLADAKLPVTFWAEAVNTACYVQNRVLVNKSQNKTPYELFNGRTPAIGFLKPFGCHVMILNTLNNLGKFEAKGDEDVSSLRYIALPNWVHDALLESSSSKPQDDCSADVLKSSRIFNPTATSTNPLADQLETLTVETPIPTVSSPVLTACFTDSLEPSSDARLISKRVVNQVEIPSLDNILTLANRFEDIFGVTTNSDESNGVEADVSNMETTVTASPTPTFRIHKDHPKSQIISPVDTPIQTKNKSKENISDALQDPSWVEAMQEELFQFKIQNVWTLVDCPKGMDVKSAFLYGTIDEEVYAMQPPGF
nr:hypothetical protein [Tanacetum cinerariifolium]